MEENNKENIENNNNMNNEENLNNDLPDEKAVIKDTIDEMTSEEGDSTEENSSEKTYEEKCSVNEISLPDEAQQEENEKDSFGWKNILIIVLAAAIAFCVGYAIVDIVYTNASKKTEDVYQEYIEMLVELLEADDEEELTPADVWDSVRNSLVEVTYSEEKTIEVDGIVYSATVSGETYGVVISTDDGVFVAVDYNSIKEADDITVVYYDGSSSSAETYLINESMGIAVIEASDNSSAVEASISDIETATGDRVYAACADFISEGITSVTSTGYIFSADMPAGSVMTDANGNVTAIIIDDDINGWSTAVNISDIINLLSNETDTESEGLVVEIIVGEDEDDEEDETDEIYDETEDEETAEIYDDADDDVTFGESYDENGVYYWYYYDGIDESEEDYTEDTETIEQEAFIGISGFTVTDYMIQTYRMIEGAYVANVVEGSNADEAGIEVGDIVTECNGITITDFQQLKEIVAEYAVGDIVTLVIGKTEGGGIYTYSTVYVELVSEEDLGSGYSYYTQDSYVIEF